MESTPYPNIRRASRALSLAFPDVDEEERQNQAYLVSVRRRTIQDAMAYLKRKSQDVTSSTAATAATTTRNTAAAAAPSLTLTTTSNSSGSNNAPQSGANTYRSEGSTRRPDTCPVASDSIGSHIGQAAMSNHAVRDTTPLTTAAEKLNRNTPLTETSRPQQPNSTSHTTTTTTTNASPMVHYLYGDNAENIEKDVFSKPGQVIVFTTSMTGERSVRDQSRALETLLYIKQIPYHYMDVADNAYLQRLVREIYLTAMRKAAQKEKQQQQQQQQGGEGVVPNHSMTSNHSNSTMGSRSTQATLTHSLQRQHLSRHHIPLPLLCVNKHLIGTYTTVQELEDDGMLVKKLTDKGYQPRSQPPPPPPPERPAPLLDGSKDTPLGNKEEEEDEETSSMRPLSSSSTQSTKEVTANTKAIASDKEGKVSKTVDGAKECKPHTKSPTPPPSRSYRSTMATNHATLNSINHTPTIQPPQQPRLGTQVERHGSSRAAGILPPSSSSPSSLSMRNQHPYRGTHHTATGAKDTRDLPNISTATTNSNTAALLEKSATGMLPGTMVNVSLPCGEQNKLSLDSAETPRDEDMTIVARTSSIIPHNSKVHIPHDSHTHHTAHENKSNNTNTTTNTTMTSVNDSIALPHPPRQPIYTSEELMRPFAKRSVITDTSSSSQPRTVTNSSMVTQGVHVPHSPAPSPDNVLLHFSHTQSPSLPRHMNTLLPVKSSRQMSDGFVNHSHHLYT